MTNKFGAHRLTTMLMIAISLIALGSTFCVKHEAQGTSTTTPDAGAETMKATPTTATTVFSSPMAGSWSAGSSDELGADIDGYLKAAIEEPLTDVMALILPHAGYQYSGPTAAYGVKQVAGKKYRRVVVIGPSHHYPLRNKAALPDATHYSTPLGEIPLDVEFMAELKKSPYVQTLPDAHAQEHSVQIEVPLLQKAEGEFRLVPIVVGGFDPEAATEFARTLARLIDAETLVVVSSDFTHFGPRFGYAPFKKDIQANIEKLDMGAFEKIRDKDADGFDRYFETTGATICGRYGIDILLRMLPKEAVAHKLKYDTSGRMMDDDNNSVSYMSVAFTGRWAQAEGSPADPPPTDSQNILSNEEKDALLKLARATLTGYLQDRKTPSLEKMGIKATDGMKQVMGVFVTLKKKGQLRGCIGEIFPSRTLYEAVTAQAVNAGVNDYRFPTVTADELPDLEFEISALTPPRPVNSYKDIVIGKHGMVIEKGGRSAVFLPQVARELGWDLATTLTQLSRKAGLPGDAWKEGASFTVFEAIVFHENKK